MFLLFIENKYKIKLNVLSLFFIVCKQKSQYNSKTGNGNGIILCMYPKENEL